MATGKIRAGIVGGAGYTGGETLRILLHHPNVAIAFVQSRSHAGQPVTTVHPDLTGDTDLIFSGDVQSADVVFLCLGHGESGKFLNEIKLPGNPKIIDLSQDFRLGEKLNGEPFVYGLPEINRETIRNASHVANPGCFATAIQLGLLPLALAGKLGAVHTTGITGSTGAGQKLQDTTHFSWRTGNISAYKTLDHQHLAEIKRTLGQAQQGFDHAIHFIPWRGNFTRGIFVTSVTDCDLSSDQLKELFQKTFHHHPFTIFSSAPIDLKMVVNTNKCLIQIEKKGNTLAIHSAIDNLLKGASGQAVQNMNLMFSLQEDAGLIWKPLAY
ncbi:MAG: N-acetyl-gamma-glutamyl-phosphate reductase [Bacteroidetes bacterium]|nr:N-acetyl-gamma-glutamyl-phosphate reductase [Bacteroidota bacterium]